MTTEGATVREQVRRGRGKGRPNPQTVQLLGEYHSAMRLELRSLLREINATIRPAALKQPRPSLAERAKLWELAIRLGKELGSEIDVAPPAEEPTPLRPNAAAADFG
jgi:hypothetical protein